jgi:hypothetical protein
MDKFGSEVHQNYYILKESKCLELKYENCQGFILPTFYEQLLCVQIPKAQKIYSQAITFLCFWDLRA